MDKSQTITIHSGADVVQARNQVRSLARNNGFSTICQARISMATSSLAYAMGLGRTHRGRITIDCMENGPRSPGVRVVCTKQYLAKDDRELETYSMVRSMVDQLTVEELPSDELQVTLVKWQA